MMEVVVKPSRITCFLVRVASLDNVASNTAVTAVVSAFFRGGVVKCCNNGFGWNKVVLRFPVYTAYEPAA